MTVTCLVCDKQMKIINDNHLAQHGLNIASYREKFPNAVLLIPKVSAKELAFRAAAAPISAARMAELNHHDKVRWFSVCDDLLKSMEVINPRSWTGWLMKQPEFMEVVEHYGLPVKDAAFLFANNLPAKPSEPTDMVTCQICQKQMTYINNRHLVSHGLTPEQYQEQFPNAEMRSPEVIAKQQENAKRINADRIGIERTEEEKAAISEGAKASHARGRRKYYEITDEHRERMNDGVRESFRNGRVSHRLGVILSDDTREKISQTLTGRTIGPEAALKAIETKRARGYDMAPMRGKKHSEESKAKIGNASREFYSRTRASRRAHMLEKMDECSVQLLNDITSNNFELECKLCNYQFYRRPSLFHPAKYRARILCDQCNPVSAVSQAEIELGFLVEEITPINRSDRVIIPPLELDIVCPSKKVAIEYCGLYWHSEAAGKDRTYHRMKLDKANLAGYRLITIFEDEWINNPQLVKSMIENTLGVSQNRIHARKCEVRRITSKVANHFLDENHIQGRGRAQYHFGLFHDSVLVSVMTFIKGEVSRRQTGWEINRFASRLNTHIPGGASRLFKAFIKEVDPSAVTSYADLRWGTGAVYGNMGFVLKEHTKPNYWYFRPNELQRFHRYTLRKKPEEPKDVTEWELRQAAGWNRIWDCGHAKWVWTKPDDTGNKLK